MNFPFWIANSTLLLCAICMFVLHFFLRWPTPDWEEINPIISAPFKKEERQQIVNIQRIYENDLFDTYKKELATIKQPEPITPFPEPPRPQTISYPGEQPVKFLEPLNVALKGIVVVSTNDRRNRAIITDLKTEHETIYKVGDMLEDSQLIRIFKNKIIFLRSNGQQEVLYLREQDAKQDPSYIAIDNWGIVVQEAGKFTYKVNIKEFLLRVTNVAQFISMLSLTTAYKNGQSIGIQLGEISNTSLGSYLGLRQGDIILEIDSIPTETTDNRLLIYKKIVRMTVGSKIKVELIRNKQKIELNYILFEQDKEVSNTEKGVKEGQKVGLIPQNLHEKNPIALTQDSKNYSVTVEEMRRRERQNMLEKGKVPLSREL